LTVAAEVTVTGRSFQTQAAAAAKDRSPTVRSLVQWSSELTVADWTTSVGAGVSLEVSRQVLDQVPSCADNETLVDCIVWNAHTAVFGWKSSDISNRWFSGLTRVLHANGISIVSAVSVGLTLGDRPTDKVT